MKILVTGGKGYIGGLLVKRLVEAGHEVSTFDLVDGQSLLDREQVHASIKGIDVVFHLAAVADLTWSARSHENMLATVDVNVQGTTNVAFACAAEGVLLQFASTCCVYGNQEVHPSTELTLPNPAEVYAYSKLAGESVVKGFGVSMGLRFNIMRYATVYGPSMREALGVSVFMRQALAGQPITVHGDGLQSRTLTYTDDLVDAQLALLQSGKVGETYNLTTEESVTAKDMAEQIKALTGTKSEVTFVEQRKHQTLREEISAEKAFKELGWKAKTSFAEGLRLTHEWFLSQPK